MDHSQINQRSLDMHIFLMKRLYNEPRRLSDLKNVWASWLALPSFSCKKAYAEAWMNAIESGVNAVVTLATSESDLHNTLRQCSPCGVLWKDDKERLDFIRQWKAKNIASSREGSVGQRHGTVPIGAEPTFSVESHVS
ncbi:MAG: hypothetical protein LBQ51_03775 [Desulfovibrio sp.]|jgi:hypothetical protein|nr:hypothetical protein [Desulfovibrio sp.]